MKKHFSLLTAIFITVSMLFGVMGCTPEVHEHSFSEEWSYDTEYHWHSATCEHLEEVNDKEPHYFVSLLVDNLWECEVCGYVVESEENLEEKNPVETPEDETPVDAKYEKAIWGKWTRIDTGEVYTISANEIRRNSWETEEFSITKESDNVLVLGSGESAARLFRKSGGLTSFTAKVAGFQTSTSRNARSATTQQALSNVKVKRQSKDISSDKDTVTSANDGTIKFDNVVAGETQTITVETESGKTVEVEVTPTFEGENIGTIPIVESGYSFKTTYSLGSGWDNEYYKFGNNYKEYTLTLNFANIGDETCSTASYELLTSDKNLSLSQTQGILTSVAAGSSKSISVTAKYGELNEYYKDVTVAIKITDSKYQKTWLDSITLRFYQTPVYLNFGSYDPNGSGNVNGFVICPDGRSEYFSGSSSIIVPYDKNGSNDYTAVFSATSDANEVAYVFNANHSKVGGYDLNTNYNIDFDTIFENPTEAFKLIDSYEDGSKNNTEATAVTIEDPLYNTASYVQYGDIDYFKLNLDNTLYSRVESFKIPKAGVSATGNKVRTVVKGQNFLSPLENLQFTCSSNYVVEAINKQIIDDKTMYVDFQIPATAKDYTVTASSECDKKESTFSVASYDVSTGDFVLKDNKIVPKEIYYDLPEADKQKVFGVINVLDTGLPVIVGLQKSEDLQWAPSETTGYNIKFTDLIAEYEGSSSEGYTFAGDLDGSDNWAYICSVDPEGTKNAATNYPAFNYANNYGKNNSLTGTDFETGWYIPSIYELYSIYENKNDLQTSLTTVGGCNFGSDYYWSSSQYSSYDYYAYQVYFSNGGVYNGNKNNSSNVLVLQAFNAQ